VPPFEETQTYVRRINGYYNDYLGTITGVDMTGSLAGFDGASAAWGNWADASVGYGAYMESTVKCGQSCSHFGFGRRFQRRMPLLELGAQGAIEGSGSGLQHEVRASLLPLAEALSNNGVDGAFDKAG